MKRILLACVAIAASVGTARADAPPPDERQAVVMSEVDRAWVLRSMRGHVDALRDITAGIAAGDLASSRNAAAAMSTEAMKADTTRPAGLRAKLPPAWITLVLAMHHEFDGIRDGVQAREDATQLMARLGRVTTQCAACHAVYRIQVGP